MKHIFTLLALLQVFPNPAHSNLTIIPDLPGSYHISITGASGRQVYTGTIHQRTELDISGWPSGPYYVSSAYKGRRETQKITIQ